MSIYYFLLIFGYLGSVISTTKNSKSFAKVFFAFMILILFIMSGFRSMNVGYDNIGHERYFYDIAEGRMSISDFRDPAYAFLSLVISFFGDYQFFLIIYSFLSLVALVLSIKYFSINPFLSLYIYYAFYFLGNNMAKLRQSMATVLLMIALIYLHKEEKNKFIIWVVIAALFQGSALLFLLALVLYKIDFKKRWMYLIIGASVFIGQSGIIEYIFFDIIGNSSFLHSLEYFGIYRIARYAKFHTTAREAGGYFGYAYILINSLMVVWFFDKLRNFNDDKAIFLAKIYYWGSIMNFLLFNIGVLNSRVTMGFLMVHIFVLPYLFKCIENKYIKFLFSTILLAGILLRGYSILLADYESFIPFEFFWQ